VDVRIYKPSKAATQSGVANSRRWVMEFESQAGRSIDRLMGWTSSKDTTQQVCLTFSNCEQAIAFANSNGMTYRVDEPKFRRPKRKAYADNFRYDKIV
ncbi:uncharacterized protein METZ01_LOCUS306371, partial [marine metagenome]